MHSVSKINKITSAANQSQLVHRMIETSSFVSLLRAKLVASKYWFPYMDSESGIPNE